MKEYKKEVNNSSSIPKDSNSVSVLYLCDKKQCDDCSYPLCKHTLDVSHAVNFKKDNMNSYVEKEK